MRERSVTILGVAVMAAALCGTAQSQPLPDSVQTVVRAHADTVRAVRYQQGREEQTERQTKTLKLGADGELSLTNIAGDIVVTRGGGSDATVDIVKTAHARTSEEAREMLGLVQVTIAERNGRAEVRAVYPHGETHRRDNRRNISVSVAYTVTAPPNTRLTINTVSGGIRVTDIKGDLTLNSISGDVRIANAGRIASSKSISGNVEILDTQIDGGLEAQSISGNVLLRKVRARQLDLGSVSGTVTIQDVQCERLEAHSISGEVEFGGALSRNGRYELSSHSGDVRVMVAGDSGFEVEASSFSGSVRSDLSLKTPARDDERGRRRSLRGVYGDGSAVLDVTTFSGSIVISKR